jgi:hypothetical protein
MFLKMLLLHLGKTFGFVGSRTIASDALNIARFVILNAALLALGRGKIGRQTRSRLLLPEPIRVCNAFGTLPMWPKEEGP